MQKDQFIQYKNKNIYYQNIGKGNTVVLLHGLPVDGNIWKEQAEVLQNIFHLIVPDISGSGRSEMLEGENISIDDYAEVIKTILDKENISQCTMIGHSIGGYITLAFAEKYPELLNGIGLFHSSAFADDEEKKQARLKTIQFIKTNGAAVFLKTLIPSLFAGKQHLKKMEALIEEGKNISAASLIQYYYAMIYRPDRTDILKNFTKPVLFIIGEKDTAVPMQASLQQCHMPAIAQVHILDSGHMGMIEQSERSLSIVESFLQNILTIN